MEGLLSSELLHLVNKLANVQYSEINCNTVFQGSTVEYKRVQSSTVLATCSLCIPLNSLTTWASVREQNLSLRLVSLK